MKKLLSYIVIFTTILFIGISAYAIDTKYKNNLLNVQLAQTPDNKVSVLLVFEHPYNEPIKVVYKAENEYNILLPETYHSVTSVSTVNTLNVRSATVKLVPYFNQDVSNGYTKITLKTTRPVIFNAHASYVTTKIAKSDLLEQLEQDEVRTIKPTTVKQANTTKAKKKATVKKASSTVKARAKKQAAKNNKAAKPVIAKSTSKKIKTYRAKKVQKYTTPRKTVQQPIKNTKPSTQTQGTQKPVTQSTVQTQPKVTEQQQHIKQEQYNQSIPNNPVEKAIIPNNELQQTQTINNKTSRFTSLANSDNATLIVLIVSSIALLLLLLKVFNKTTQNYSMRYNKFTRPTQKQDNQTEIPNNIKNMSWQEKYRFMKKQEEDYIEQQEAKKQEELSNQIDEIYETSETETSNIGDSSQSQSYNEISNDPFNLNTAIVNEGFEPAYQEIQEENYNADDENSTFEEIIQNEENIEPVQEQQVAFADNESAYVSKPIEPIEPTLINQAKISKTKGFYLIRYGNEVALMGYVKDQIFLIHSFGNNSQSFVQTRLTEKKRGADIYLVRSDNYKALVEVSKDEMRTLINL